MSKALKDQGLSFTSFSIKSCLRFILKIINLFPRNVLDTGLHGGGKIQNWRYLKKNPMAVLFGMPVILPLFSFWHCTIFFCPNAQSILNLSLYSRVNSV